MGTPLDAAFYLQVLALLGTQNTAERVSLTAERSVGGLQLASMVECAVSSVASELLFLLNGNTTASELARDSIREAMRTDPEEACRFSGLVARTALPCKLRHQSDPPPIAS